MGGATTRPSLITPIRTIGFEVGIGCLEGGLQALSSVIHEVFFAASLRAKEKVSDVVPINKNHGNRLAVLGSLLAVVIAILAGAGLFCAGNCRG